ncbi:hypothetical protein E2562_025191 [Oryza meyeriana var. granulata]|uniref:PA domain-containing protein n=1 Tax=Oryza meyeriana var. granulata TaxID=110450 RepID=A0A6G1E1N1_9ORYZ|nr:hypothetical protein E2562_025191 [Oryza meyeriana var. granulata]
MGLRSPHAMLWLALVWASLLCTCCHGRFVVEKNSLKVTAPSDLKGTYECAIGNFGVPQYGGTMYGGTMVGVVAYPKANKKACKSFDDFDISYKAKPGSLPTFLLVDRGDCFFTKKAWNAQNAGAAAILVADDKTEPLITMDTPEESGNTDYLENITIPSALITKSFGDKLKKAIDNGDMVNVNLDWRESLPHPDERVEYEFWTNSNDECGPKCDSQIDFVKSFKGAAQVLEKKGYTQFTPHYITWYCPDSFILSKQCKSQCINHGRYCAPDPEQDFSKGYDGKDVVIQNLRQVCVYKIAKENGKPWLWWDYVTDFAIRCPMKEKKYTKECADGVIKSLGLDHKAIDKCIGDPDADKENPVLKAEQDSQIGKGSRGDVTILPTLVINNRQYRGKLDKGAVLKAICAGFRETTEPADCLSEDIQTNECLENNGGCWQDKAANISACKLQDLAVVKLTMGDAGRRPGMAGHILPALMMAANVRMGSKVMESTNVKALQDTQYTNTGSGYDMANFVQRYMDSEIRAIMAQRCCTAWPELEKKPTLEHESQDASVIIVHDPPASDETESGSGATATAVARCPHPHQYHTSSRNLALDSAIQAAISSDNGKGWGWLAGVGGFLSRIFSAGAARAADGGKQPPPDWDAHGLAASTLPVPLSRLDRKKRYKVSELTFLDHRTRAAAAEDPLFDDGMPALRPGGVYARSQLLHELDALASSGMFDHVTLHGKPKPDGTLGLTVSYAETEWPAADRLKLINVAGLMARRPANELVRRSKPCILPETLQKELQGMVEKQRKVSSRLLKRIARRVERRWYHDEGFLCAKVVNYHGNLHSGEVVCEVVEGDITKVEYQFHDKLGNVVDGNKHIPLIDRELPQQCRSAASQPRPDETNQGGVIVAIKLKEQDPKSAQVITEWSIVPGRQGQPTLASIQPAGTVSFEHRNICGLRRSLLGSVTSSNLLNPQIDQGLGIGSKKPCFNRHQLTMTKFINLNKRDKGTRKPPPAVLALHGRYAGCVGDLASYDAFALGGPPHSVRGYGMGELGASRNLLEVATELSVPITVKNKHTQVYAFVEHGTDLGSSKDVKGNPTEFFRRAGHGSSYGVGVKLGATRAEYAVDHNAGRGAFFLRFGERF